MKKRKFYYLSLINFSLTIFFFALIPTITAVEPLIESGTVSSPLTITEIKQIAQERVATSLGITLFQLQALLTSPETKTLEGFTIDQRTAQELINQEKIKITQELDFIKKQVQKKLAQERIATSLGITINELQILLNPEGQNISSLVNKKYPNGWTMFMQIAKGKLLCKGYAKFVYKECSDKDYANAIRDTYTTIANMLINEGIDINQRNNRGKSALMIAFNQNNKPIIELLSKYTINFDEQDESGRSLLHHAIKLDYDNIACEWTQRKIPPPLDATTIETTIIRERRGKFREIYGFQETPLMFAARRNSLPVVKCLLYAGANPLLKNSVGQTAFDIAKEDNVKSILKKAMKIREAAEEKIATIKKMKKIAKEAAEKGKRRIVMPTEEQLKESIKKREEMKRRRLEKERMQRHEIKQARQREIEQKRVKREELRAEKIREAKEKAAQKHREITQKFLKEVKEFEEKMTPRMLRVKEMRKEQEKRWARREKRKTPKEQPPPKKQIIDKREEALQFIERKSVPSIIRDEDLGKKTDKEMLIDEEMQALEKETEEEIKETKKRIKAIKEPIIKEEEQQQSLGDRIIGFFYDWIGG